MTTDTPPCCRLCKGRAPHMFCRSGTCKCHTPPQQSAKTGQSLYRDPVAEQAIGRADSDFNGVGLQGRPVYLKGYRR